MLTDRQLTAREIEILQLMADGLERDEIGVKLRLSPHTIRNHRHKIYRILKARTAGQAVAIAMREKLIK